VNDLSRVITLCAAIALTGCGEEDPQQYINEGKALFEKGEMKSAGVQFKNALQIQPKAPEAFYGLALIAEKQADWKSMRRNLVDLIAIDPNHVDAHAKLGLLLIGDIDKAKEQMAIALTLDSENIEAILLDGRIQHKEKNNAGALSQVDRVLAKDAMNTDAIWLQATIFISDKRYDEALTVLNQTIAARSDNDDVGLDMLRIRLYKEQEKHEEVIRGYDELIAKRPEDKTFRYNQIEILSRFGKPGQVEKKIREAISNDPEDVGLKLGLVDFSERSDAAQAEALLKEFVEANPDELRFKTRLAGFYIGNSRNSEAQDVLNKIVVVDPTGKDGLTAKVRLAEIAWKDGDKITAEKLTSEVLSVDTGNSDALLFRAGMHLNSKDPDGAISDLRIVLRDQPNSDQAMVMLAQANMLNGEPEVAESNWRKALEANPGNLSAIMPLTSALLKRRDTVRAEELLIKSLKVNPENVSVLELLVKVRASKKDWAGAEATVNKMKKMPHATLVAQMLEGMLAASKGRHLEAIQVYQGVLEQKPDSPEALMMMARSYEASGRRAEYIAFLKAFIEEKPDNIVAYNTLGMVYAADKRWDAAAKILQQALSVDSKSLRSYKFLATVLTQQGKTAEVIELYRKGMVEFPDNAELILELAGQFELNKDYASAISIYKSLLKKFPDNDVAANNFADVLLNFSNDQTGLQQALSLAVRFKDSDNPYFLDTYGWVLFKTGEFEKAVAVLKQSAKVAPENAAIRYHLGESLYAVGDHSASKLELEKSLLLVKKNNEFAGIKRAIQLLKEIGGSAHS